MQLAAANKTPLPKIVIGNIICEVGDIASVNRGVNNANRSKRQSESDAHESF